MIDTILIYLRLIFNFYCWLINRLIYSLAFNYLVHFLVFTFIDARVYASFLDVPITVTSLELHTNFLLLLVKKSLLIDRSLCVIIFSKLLYDFLVLGWMSIDHGDKTFSVLKIPLIS